MSPLPAQAAVLPVSAPTPARGVAADPGKPAERDATDFNAVLTDRLAGKGCVTDGRGPAPSAPALADDEAAAENPAQTPAAADPTDPSALIGLIGAQIAAPVAVPAVATQTLGIESQSSPGAPSAQPAPLAPASGKGLPATATAANLFAAVAPDTAATASVDPTRQDALAVAAAPPETAAGNAGSTAVPTADLAASIRHAAEASAEIAPGSIDPGTAATDASPLHHAPATHRSTPADAPPSMRVETPVTAPRWGEDLAQKVVWLAGRNENRAELVLTPPQLGKVEVSLSVSHTGETSASFVSASPQVREVLEQSMSRLREVFAAAGISLGQTSVSGESPARDQRGEGRSGRGRMEALAPVALPAGTGPMARQRGLVDTFA